MNNPNLIRRLDIFGQSVQLTFRKESRYTTTIGGIASIFFFTVLILIIGLKTMQFTDLSNAQTYISNTMILDDHDLDLFKLKYRFAIE